MARCRRGSDKCPIGLERTLINASIHCLLCNTFGLSCSPHFHRRYMETATFPVGPKRCLLAVMNISMSLLFAYSRTTSATLALTRYVRDVLPGTSATQNSTTFELTVCPFVKNHPLVPSLSQAEPLSRLSASRKATIVPQIRVTPFSSATKRMPALVATIQRITVHLATPAHVRLQLCLKH